MKYFLIPFFALAALLHGQAQDSTTRFPSRYIKWSFVNAGGGGLRLEAEFKRTRKRSKSLAVTTFLNTNRFTGCILEGFQRHYLDKKKRWFWSYHVAMGYVQYTPYYLYTRSVTYPGIPSVTYETTEIVYSTHKMPVLGTGTGFGWQRPLGNKGKWLLEVSTGFRYYYHPYSRPKNEVGVESGVIVKEEWSEEGYKLWKTVPWDKGISNSMELFESPFSALYLNLSVGHSF